MSSAATRKDRIAAKRAEQARLKAAKGDRPVKTQLSEVELKVEIAEKEKLLERCDDELDEIAERAEYPLQFKLDPKKHYQKIYGYFIGPGSGAMNERYQFAVDHYKRVKLQLENYRNQLDPTRAARIHAEKVAAEQLRKASDLIWGVALQNEHLLNRAEKPLKVDENAEVVTRSCPGFLMKLDSVAKCTHASAMQFLECDCKRTGPQDFKLSDRAKALADKNMLIVEDYQLIAQQRGLSNAILAGRDWVRNDFGGYGHTLFRNGHSVQEFVPRVPPTLDQE